MRREPCAFGANRATTSWTAGNRLLIHRSPSASSHLITRSPSATPARLVVRVGLDANGRAEWLQWNSRRALRIGELDV